MTTDTPKPEKPPLVRLSVNMNQETAALLKSYAETRGLSYTQCVRRMVAITSFVQDEVDAGRTVLSVDEDRKDGRELVLL